MGDLEELRQLVRKFSDEREWAQFHDPKNLAMAVASEAGELLAEFRWLTPAQSRLSEIDLKVHDAVRLEMADVLIFLIRIADVLDIDLDQAVRAKLEINEKRFPPD